MIAASTNFPASIDVLDPIIGRIVGRKVERLVRRGVIQRQDALDLEHDLYVRVLNGWASFDPEQSHPYAFVTTVVERSVATILRDRKAEKRDPARIEPLTCDVARDCESIADSELSIDVTNVLAELPDELRNLAERLKQASVSQVARDANVSRKVIYRQVRKLRERLEEFAPVSQSSADDLS